jgi:hypothetical protein
VTIRSPGIVGQPAPPLPNLVVVPCSQSRRSRQRRSRRVRQTPTVITARDGLPDNIPGHNDAFHPAVPITLETVAGNTITVDLGDSQFAYYMHLQPGSLRVKAGERVRRGQVLARVGCSGDARGPHLHFEVTDSPKLIAGEGLPYVIDRYRTKSAGGGPKELRIRELPMNNSLIEFAGGHE